MNLLAVLGVEHDSKGGTHRASGEVGGEASDHDSLGSVGASDAAPDGSEASASDALLGLVDVDHSFAEVVPAGLLFVDSLDFDQSLVGSVIVPASSEWRPWWSSQPPS